MRFVVVLNPEEEGSGYNVSVPALPGCFSQGETVEQSLERARDAIETYLKDETSDSLRAAGVDPRVIIASVDVDAAISA